MPNYSGVRAQWWPKQLDYAMSCPMVGESPVALGRSQMKNVFFKYRGWKEHVDRSVRNCDDRNMPRFDCYRVSSAELPSRRPHNREISLVIGNTIGRFFTGPFQSEQTVSNSCYHVFMHRQCIRKKLRSLCC